MEISLCSPDCPEICSVDHDGLKFRSSASASLGDHCLPRDYKDAYHHNPAKLGLNTNEVGLTLPGREGCLPVFNFHGCVSLCPMQCRGYSCVGTEVLGILSFV